MHGLHSERLMLRRWEDRDRDTFHHLGSDDAIMRFFPFRKSRAESDATMDEWNTGFERTGMGFLALERLSDGKLIGMLGMAPVEEPIYTFAPTVQIGWRLLPEAHGQGFATEGGRACLAYGFGPLNLSEIVSQCVVENAASEAVMRRLGLRHAGIFAHPKVDPETHPHLVLHSLYRLTANEWGQTGGRLAVANSVT